MMLGGHEHYNWAFTQLGIYDLMFSFEGLNAQNQVIMTGGDTFRVNIIPEPSRALMLGGGMIALLLRRRRERA